MRNRTLLVIGDPTNTSRSNEPRKDFDLITQTLHADVIDPPRTQSRGGRFRTGLALARAAAKVASEYDNIYCDSEHIGIPLAWLLRASPQRPRLTVLAHYLTPLKKRLLCRALRPARAIDAVVIHSPAQVRRAIQCGFASTQIHCIPYQVDTDFWSPIDAPALHVGAAGQEFRDYATLVEAVSSLPVRVEVAAGSLWSSRKVNINTRTLPANVCVARRPYSELRAMYAQSHFVVVPLHDVDFQAGIITILEAAAMGKAVIVSRTRGQTGVVSGTLRHRGAAVDIGERSWPNETGIYVPPGDAESLREAIAYLLDHPDIARSMGNEARRQAEASFSIDHFIERMTAVIVGTGTPQTATPVPDP